MSLLNKFRPKNQQKDTYQEILENLCDILNNSKHIGSLDHRMGFDYTYSSKNSLIEKKVMASIKECIELFEPRIDILKIRALSNGSPFYFTFEIVFLAKGSEGTFYLNFDGKEKLFFAKDNYGINESN